MVSKQELDKFLAKLISDEEKNLLNKNVFIKTIVAVVFLLIAMALVFVVVFKESLSLF